MTVLAEWRARRLADRKLVTLGYGNSTSVIALDVSGLPPALALALVRVGLVSAGAHSPYGADGPRGLRGLAEDVRGLIEELGEEARVVVAFSRADEMTPDGDLPQVLAWLETAGAEVVNIELPTHPKRKTSARLRFGTSPLKPTVLLRRWQKCWAGEQGYLLDLDWRRRALFADGRDATRIAMTVWAQTSANKRPLGLLPIECLMALAQEAPVGERRTIRALASALFEAEPSISEDERVRWLLFRAELASRADERARLAREAVSLSLASGRTYELVAATDLVSARLSLRLTKELTEQTTLTPMQAARLAQRAGTFEQLPRIADYAMSFLAADAADAREALKTLLPFMPRTQLPAIARVVVADPNLGGLASELAERMVTTGFTDPSNEVARCVQSLRGEVASVVVRSALGRSKSAREQAAQVVTAASTSELEAVATLEPRSFLGGLSASTITDAIARIESPPALVSLVVATDDDTDVVTVRRISARLCTVLETLPVERWASLFNVSHAAKHLPRELAVGVCLRSLSYAAEGSRRELLERTGLPRLAPLLTRALGSGTLAAFAKVIAT